AGSVTHTADAPLDTNPWWQVDLGSSQAVGTIKLFNRTDCCADRLRQFHVFASDTPFTSTDPATTAAQAGVFDYYQSTAAGSTLSIPVNRTARYVRVQLVGTDRPLSLAEVQVLG
ncbi:MAG TPA: discoidin domain-containing protein, partial [Actinokineospora sp.]|nr:discoidin domain-containing protein [Actinokineospora sp.]